MVGAGPVGLTLALRLAQFGLRTVVFDGQLAHTAVGSRAICMQRETLEIWGRLGIGDRVADRGVQWRVGRTYRGTTELFAVRLPGETGDHYPPFVNISQAEVTELLLDRCISEGVAVRWGWRLIGLEQDEAGVVGEFETGGGARGIDAPWLVGCDGAHSSVRHALGLPFAGYSFDDQFLICDIRARLPFPAERRFHFDPPWNPGRQVLIHPQPDDVWRIDWQVPGEIDLDEERRSGRLAGRIRAVIGSETPYELVWATGYRFSQRLASGFRAGRVFLAGDAAHLMSPFGARGLNSGVADAENLAWKLGLVARGHAPDALLDSYDAERRGAALENLAITEATMRFMVPHGWWRRGWRDLVLRLSARSTWFRARVNSGRLSQPAVYDASAIVAPGPDDPSLPRHGAVAPDLPLDAGRGRLRDLIGRGTELVILLAGGGAPSAARARGIRFPVPVRVAAPPDANGRVAARYAPSGPRAWVIRPDGHLADSRPMAAPGALELLPAMAARAVALPEDRLDA